MWHKAPYSPEPIAFVIYSAYAVTVLSTAAVHHESAAHGSAVKPESKRACLGKSVPLTASPQQRQGVIPVLLKATGLVQRIIVHVEAAEILSRPCLPGIPPTHGLCLLHQAERRILRPEKSSQLVSPAQVYSGSDLQAQLDSVPCEICRDQRGGTTWRCVLAVSAAYICVMKPHCICRCKERASR